jgi:hypothetical protein
MLIPEVENLKSIPKFVNPTRSNCSEIILREQIIEDLGFLGVFATNEDQQWALCCVD